MSKTEIIQIRVTPELKKKIQSYANYFTDGNMSEFIIDCLNDEVNSDKYKKWIDTILDAVEKFTADNPGPYCPMSELNVKGPCYKITCKECIIDALKEK